jgi:hypothetical protein
MESTEKEEKIERRKSVAGKESLDSIRVICRFRPPKAIEIEMHGQSTKLENFVIDEERGTVSVDIDFERKNFTYDKVNAFDRSSSISFRSLESIVHKLKCLRQLQIQLIPSWLALMARFLLMDKRVQVYFNLLAFGPI